MKNSILKITTLLSFLFFFTFFINNNISAQASICNATIPTTTCPVDTVLCPMELSDQIVVTMASSLPNLEYIILDQNQQASNGSGPAIIGFDVDGQIIPQDLGVDSTTVLQILPVAYDLAAIQETLDDLLKGSFLIIPFPPISVTCCSVSMGICDQLNAAGINCGSDFTSLGQAFSLISSDTSELFSIPDLINGIDSINAALADPVIPSECGGGDMICYAYGSSCSFNIQSYAPLLTFTLPEHTASISVSADTIQSSATVSAGLMVDYLFGIEVTLMNGFEAQLNSTFSAEPGGCD